MHMTELLKSRFSQNLPRHADIPWELVENRLRSRPEAAEALRWMEENGGEPDVIGMDGDTVHVVIEEREG